MKSTFTIFSVFIYLTIFSQNVDKNPSLAGFKLGQNFNERDLVNYIQYSENLKPDVKDYLNKRKEDGKFPILEGNPIYDIMEKNKSKDAEQINSYTTFITTYGGFLINNEYSKNYRYLDYYPKTIKAFLYFVSPAIYNYHKTKTNLNIDVANSVFDIKNLSNSNEQKLVGVRIVIESENDGWKQTDFDQYIESFKAKYGEPDISPTKGNPNLKWIWSGKNNIMTIQYLFSDSFSKPRVILELSKRAFYELYR